MKRFSIDILRKNNIKTIIEFEVTLSKGLPTDKIRKNRVWSFNDNYKCIEKFEYNRKGEIKSGRRFYYSENNILTRVEMNNTDSEFKPPSIFIVYYYNELGLLSKEVNFNESDNSVEWYRSFEYDSKGLCTKINFLSRNEENVNDKVKYELYNSWPINNNERNASHVDD